MTQPAPQPVIHDGKAYLNVGGTLMGYRPEDVPRALQSQPLARLATEDEVRRRLEEKQQEGFVGGAKAAGSAFVEGAYGAIAAVPRGLAALGYVATESEAVADFLRASAPNRFLPNLAGEFAYATSSGSPLEALNEQDQEILSVERSRAAQRREWSNLTTVAEMTGLVAGSIATAYAGGAAVGAGARGLGVGGQALQSASAAELAFGGGVLRQTAIGAAEGFLQGASEAFNAGGTPTQRDVLGAALINAVIAGALSGGSVALLNRIPDVDLVSAFGKPARKVGEWRKRLFRKSAASTEDEAIEGLVRALNPDAPPGTAKAAAEVADFVDQLNAEQYAKIQAAGPNPEAIRKAARDALEETRAKTEALRKAQGRIDADNWDKVRPAVRPILHDEVMEGAARDLERVHNRMLAGADGVEAVLKNSDIKEAVVAKNLAESAIDETRALGAAREVVTELRRSLDSALYGKRAVPTSFLDDALEELASVGGTLQAQQIRSVASTGDLRRVFQELDALDNTQISGAVRSALERARRAAQDAPALVSTKHLDSALEFLAKKGGTQEAARLRAIARMGDPDVLARAIDDLADTASYSSIRNALERVKSAAQRAPDRELPEFFSQHRQRVNDIMYSLKKADSVIASTRSPSEAYLALDQVRRNVLDKIEKFQGSISKGSTEQATDAAQVLWKWAYDAYDGKLLPHLADESIWGKQGQTQSLINWFWRDKISAGRVAENNITTVVDKSFGKTVRAADPDKARALLQSLDENKRSLRTDRLLDYYQAQENMALAVKQGYALTPEQIRMADDAISSARRAQQILQTVESQSITLTGRIVRALLDSGASRVTGAIAGTGAGAVGGGFGGAMIGASIGAAVLPVVQDTAKNLVRRVAIAGTKEAAEVAAKKWGPRTLRAEVKPLARAIRKELGVGVAEEAATQALEKVDPRFAPAVGGRLLFQTEKELSRAERIKIHEDRRVALNEITSSPEKAQAGIDAATRGLGAHPVFQGALGVTMIEKLRALQAAWPGRSSVSPIPSLAYTTVSGSDLRKSEAYWQATVDPASVFTDWENGVVDYDKVRFAQAQWPELFTLYQAAVIDQLTGLPPGVQVSTGGLTQLDFLLGFGGRLSPTVAPDFSRRIDAYAEQMAEQREKQRSGGNLDLPTAQPTYTERVASGSRRT